MAPIFIKKYTYCALILFSCTLFLYSCTSKPRQISVLSSASLPRTYSELYPDIKTFYASDKEIALRAVWAKDAFPSKNHTFKWEIYSSEGEMVYQRIKNDTIIEPYIYYEESIPLDESLKMKLSNGPCKINFFIDGKFIKEHEIQYDNSSIINHNIKKVVILPIKNISAYHNLGDSSEQGLINTMGFVLFNETKRVAPSTVHHYAAMEMLDKKASKDCLENPACIIPALEKTFGRDAIFIFGEIYLSKFVNDPLKMTITTYDARNGEKTQFKSTVYAKRTYGSSIKKLMIDVMETKGYLQYFREYE